VNLITTATELEVTTFKECFLLTHNLTPPRSAVTIPRRALSHGLHHYLAPASVCSCFSLVSRQTRLSMAPGNHPATILGHTLLSGYTKPSATELSGLRRSTQLAQSLVKWGTIAQCMRTCMGYVRHMRSVLTIQEAYVRTYPYPLLEPRDPPTLVCIPYMCYQSHYFTIESFDFYHLITLNTCLCMLKLLPVMGKGTNKVIPNFAVTFNRTQHMLLHVETATSNGKRN